MNRRTIILLASLLAIGTACGRLGTLPKGFTTHDFGTPSTIAYTPSVPLRLIEVRSPSWLGSSAMQYRFKHEHDQRRQVYTENRWVAPPGELLEAALRRALSHALPQGGGCSLLIELDEFSQMFESASTSFGLLEARAMLVSPRADAVLAQQRLSFRVPAQSPDASGGAIALRQASLELASGLDAWLGTLDRSSGGALNIDVLCR